MPPLHHLADAVSRGMRTRGRFSRASQQGRAKGRNISQALRGTPDHILQGAAPARGLGSLKTRYCERRCHMMKLITAVALAAMIMASPAFAQSYDPDLGSGNIAPAYGR